MDDKIFPRGSGFAQAPWSNGEEQNGRTMVWFAGGVFCREPLPGQIALARYESALRRAAREHARDRTFVAVVDSDGSLTRHQVIEPGEALVFGRHEQARLRHPAEDVSLRHIAVASAPSSTAEAPLVRAWDLMTGRCFETEDGQVTEAITADGPVFATIGSVYLAIIPLASLPETLPLGTLALWLALPDREVISRVAEGSSIRPLQPAVRSKAGRTSMITRILPAQAPVDCHAELSVAELTLTSDEGCQRYRISSEALERGILIGRYERCMGIGKELDSLSRVHLLISKVGTDILAIDTASTFGSKRSMDTGFESIVLRKKEKMLLADALLVEWNYRGLEKA